MRASSALTAAPPSFRAVRTMAVSPGAKTPRRKTAVPATARDELASVVPPEIARETIQQIHDAAKVIAKKTIRRNVTVYLICSGSGRLIATTTTACSAERTCAGLAVAATLRSASRAVSDPVAWAGSKPTCPVAGVRELTAVEREAAAADALGESCSE